MSDNQLVPTQHGELDSWGNLDSTDIKAPQVSIGQPTSRKGEPGKFNFSDGRSVSEFVGVRLLVPWKTRVLYQGLDSKARCSSDNFMVPALRIENPISQNCLTCPASQWGEDDPVKKALHAEVRSKSQLKVPLCKETHNLLCIDDQGSIFSIKLQGTQINEVRNKLYNRIKLQFRAPHYAVKFDMKLVKVTAANGVYYSVVYDNFQKLEGGDLDYARNLYLSTKENYEQSLAETHAQMDKDKETDDVPF